jgi:hypothetical protein
MWFWRKMGKIGWTDRVRNGEVWHAVKEERDNTLTIREGMKPNLMSQFLRRD